jgi:hypothetical protein
MRPWVSSLLDACLNVCCANAIYKHIYHVEYTNMYKMLKWCQNIFVNKFNFFFFFFFTACKFVTACRDKNIIRDSTIWEKKVIWWHGALFHVILTWDLVYPYIKKQTIGLKLNKPENHSWAYHTRFSHLSRQGITRTCSFVHIWRRLLCSQLNYLALWTTRSHTLGVNSTIISPSCKYAIINASSCMNIRGRGFSRWVGEK